MFVLVSLNILILKTELAEFWINYKTCKLQEKYNILSKYEQGTNIIQLVSLCFSIFAMFGNVATGKSTRSHWRNGLMVLRIFVI